MCMHVLTHIRLSYIKAILSSWNIYLISMCAVSQRLKVSLIKLMLKQLSVKDKNDIMFFVTWHVLYDNYLWFAIPGSCRLYLLSEFRGHIQAAFYDQCCYIKDNKQMYFMDCTINCTLAIWSKMSSHGANSWALINCIIILSFYLCPCCICVLRHKWQWDFVRTITRTKYGLQDTQYGKQPPHCCVWLQDTNTSLTFWHKQWIPFLLERAGELMAFQTVLQIPFWGSGMNSLQ